MSTDSSEKSLKSYTASVLVSKNKHPQLRWYYCLAWVFLLPLFIEPTTASKMVHAVDVFVTLLPETSLKVLSVCWAAHCVWGLYPPYWFSFLGNAELTQIKTVIGVSILRWVPTGEDPGKWMDFQAQEDGRWRTGEEEFAVGKTEWYWKDADSGLCPTVSTLS